MKKRSEKNVVVAQVILFLFIISGGFLIAHLFGVFPEDLSTLLVAIISFFIGIGLFVVSYRLIIAHKKRKNGNAPLMDERSYQSIRNYFLGILYLIIVISSVVILVLVGSGVQEVTVISLVFYLIATYLVIGVGFVIVALKN